MKNVRNHTALVVSAIIIYLAGCVKEFPNQPVTPREPKTFLWLFPEGDLREGVSRTKLYWWGDVQNGYVKGYLFSFTSGIGTLPVPDTLAYTYLTANDSIVQFPLYSLRDTFLVVVRAVSNSFSGIPVGSSVHLYPEPYWDKNRNSMFDAGDEKLATLAGTYDTRGARQRFPIRNTPPNVEFQKDVNGAVIHQPETTYTVASFSWIGSDPDGDQTIASYQLALNSTADDRWLTVSSGVALVTLAVPRSVSDNAAGEVQADVYGGTFPNMRHLGKVNGLRLDGLNTFYVRARDVAGEYSPVAQLPQAGKQWFVKKPRGRMLMINDYARPDSTALQNFYRSVFSEVAGGVFAQYDELNIRRGATSSGTGVLVPAILNPQFVETLRLYDVIYWYTDRFPSLSVAQFPLYLFTQAGGKVVYTTEFQDAVSDPRGSLVDFAPLDSIFSGNLVGRPTPVVPTNGDTRIPKNYNLLPSPESAGYPLLAFDSLSVQNQPIPFHSIFMRRVYKRTDARYLYRLQADQQIPQRYLGMPDLAVIDNQQRFVFFGIPIHTLNGKLKGGQGISALLTKIFRDEFGF